MFELEIDCVKTVDIPELYVELLSKLDWFGVVVQECGVVNALFGVVTSQLGLLVLLVPVSVKLDTVTDSEMTDDLISDDVSALCSCEIVLEETDIEEPDETVLPLEELVPEQ